MGTLVVMLVVVILKRAHCFLPEIIVAGSPNFVAITNHIADESWTEITSKIDSISGFPTEACTNTKDNEEETKWCEGTSTDIAIIFQCVDQEHQQARCNELREELTCLCHEGCWVCAEDAGSGCF